LEERYARRVVEILAGEPDDEIEYRQCGHQNEARAQQQGRDGG
jgi:hypothetical protein